MRRYAAIKQSNYRTIKLTACLAISLLAICLPRPIEAQGAAPPAGIDGYVMQVMRTFEVPGLSLAIVKDGRVVLARGYGVRELGKPEKVDGHTLFGIASNTKAFTSTALGILVEEGRIEWDAPVIRYLPSFAMYDPFVTREMTIRDLLVHRSGLGLGAGDLLWWPESDLDRKEIVRRLRYIKPKTSFRSAYAYDNVLYGVAGEVIEAVTGESWEDFVARRILARVGMTESNVRHSRGGSGTNTATPHAKINGTVQPVAPFTSDNVNPAGGINSNALDMARWVMVQLDSGRLADGGRLFHPRTTRQLWGMVTPMPIGNPPRALAHLRPSFRGYALGFRVSDYRGHKMVSHTGGLPGYVSRVTMIPDIGLGVVVLTNQESGFAFNAVTYYLLDRYLGADPPDYVGVYRSLADARRARIARAVAQSTSGRDSLAGPSLPLERYAGTYTDRWYGDVYVRLENGALTIEFSHTRALTGRLEHWQYDTFVARWNDRGLRADAYVTFQLNADGSIDRVKMAPFSPETDFSYDFQDLELRRRE